MKKNPVITTRDISNNRTLEDVRSDVNVLLTAYIERQQSRANTLSPDYGFMWEAIASQFSAGGKRLRPYLCLLVYELLGGRDYTSVLPAAASLELLHAAMLVHDDIIDRDYTRHNQPNVGGIYKNHYKAIVVGEAEAIHFANSAAILAGDVLLSDSYQLIAGSNIPSEQRVAAAQLIGEAVYHVSAGELLDTEAALYPADYSDSLKIAQLKTAFYTCSVPMAMGGMLAGASSEVTKSLQQIGNSLGIAFQLADDLLGIFGLEALTGKTTVGDLREGKRTHLLQRTLQLANEVQQQVLATIVGNSDCDEAMTRQVQQIMIDCGARHEIEALMTDYVAQANRGVAELPTSAAGKARLSEFITQAVWRNS